MGVTYKELKDTVDDILHDANIDHLKDDDKLDQDSIETLLALLHDYL